ncbi:hypothetical protein Tsubulata_005823, partial [Turnera subulata]
MATPRNIESKAEKYSPGNLQPILPMELIINEILTRMEVKDLLRFKCVSKEWKLLIEDRYFVHKHLYHSPIGRFPLVKQSFHFLQSYHGLILEYSWKFRIRNPAMEQVFSVPNPQKASRMMRIGFAPTSGLYKLVSIYDSDVAGNGYGGVEILVLGTEDKPSWKHVDSTHLRSFDWNDRPSGYVADQGVVHIAKTSKIQSRDHEVMSFDLDTESFRGHKLVVPRSVFPAGSDVSLVYGAFLVALANDELHILGLQDCEEVKDLFGFKCVSKELNHLIGDHYFVRKHLDHSPSGTFPVAEQPPFAALQSSDGLILEKHNVSKEFRIRNPAMGQVFYIPNPHKRNRVLRYGFAPISGFYKLICLYDCNVAGNGNGGVEILLLDPPKLKRKLQHICSNKPTSK